MHVWKVSQIDVTCHTRAGELVVEMSETKRPRDGGNTDDSQSRVDRSRINIEYSAENKVIWLRRELKIRTKGSDHRYQLWL